MAVALATVVGWGASCGKEPAPRAFSRRLVILGFDGVDPKLLSRWMDEGKLPKLRELASKGDFRPLVSTNPPQSPVAWTTFATGTPPGRHGIFDFVERDPKTYLPDVGTGGVKPPTYWMNTIQRTPAEGFTRRHGVPFWQTAATNGVPVVVLRVPYAFPADPVPGGRMLSGLGVPDLLGTNSTFTYLATDLGPTGGRGEPGGGRLVPLTVQGDEVSIEIPGPADPRGGGRPGLKLPLTVHVDRAGDAAVLRFAGREERVKRGGWTPWLPFRLPVAAPLGIPLASMDGLCRFYVMSLDPLHIYLSPLNYAPEHPFAPISSPESFAGSLSQALGAYKTVGWSEDTSGLNSERLDEQGFLDDLNHTMDEVRASTLHELERKDWQLLISVFTQTDRVSHMFYRFFDTTHPKYDAALAARFGDAIQKTYQRMDDIVGEILPKLGPETTLIVMSDHGFHSYKMGLNVNTWLRDHGYLVQGVVPPGHENDDFFPGVDWSKTRAYALGTGQIYVNLKGREGRGIVNPGAEYDALLDSIAHDLEAEVDPATNERFVEKVYEGPKVFAGASPERMPDLQIAFRDGYRASWRTPLGGIPKNLLEPNTKKWSGDHACSDVVDTPGIIVSNRKLQAGEPAIVDLAPTALKFLGVPVPPDMTGHALLEVGT